MKRRILAASNEKPEIDLLVSDLKDDFDYIMSGLDKLDRTGDTNTALEIGKQIASDFQNYILNIADEIQE